MQLLTLSVLAAVLATAAAAKEFQVVVSESGTNYSLNIRNQTWLASGSTFFRSGQSKWTTDDHSQVDR
jgi:hypothetical protein